MPVKPSTADAPEKNMSTSDMVACAIEEARWSKRWRPKNLNRTCAEQLLDLLHLASTGAVSISSFQVDGLDTDGSDMETCVCSICICCRQLSNDATKSRAFTAIDKQRKIREQMETP
uniref:Uncharacterized protein n=1 Tax=Pristionchus pacificus TaxID=54126 RepID=A0A2A6BSX6_PRIPA|eukprot:PDM69004.1 hypothetical protein PRIPAC_47306 [Pristionchus pacificus]